MSQTPQTILCAGEALIDMLPRQTETGEAAFAPYAGGAVFNTAIALGRLGAEVALLSGVSTDLFGQVLVDTLSASNVAGSYLLRSDRPSTLAFVSFVKGEARYAFYDENTAGRMIVAAELPALGPEVGAVFLGGISLAVEPCAEAYAALAQTAREAGRLVMIDPNIRPGFIRNEPRYRARIAQMFTLSDIVKVSDMDLGWLTGASGLDAAPLEAVSAAARRLLAQQGGQGPKLICVTLGARGALAVSATDTVFVDATAVQVVDTVGAGDTFNAGVLSVLARTGALSVEAVAAADGALLEACLRMGTRAAAFTVGRAGANPPWAAELGL